MNDLGTFLIVKPIKIIGVLLVLGVPIFHNLHNIFFNQLSGVPVEYYKNGYYFAVTILHSIAPALGFLGCFFLIDGKIKGILIVPFGYEIYKAIEKIPTIRKDYSIYHEFWVASAFFMIAILPLGWLFSSVRFKINRKLKQAINEINYVGELAREGMFDSQDVFEENKRIAEKLERELELLDK